MIPDHINLPGVHEWTDAEYFACQAVNNSSLKPALIDPALFYVSEIEGDRTDPTRNMERGTHMHDFILRPKHMGTRYEHADKPVNSRTGKPYGDDTKYIKQWRESFGDVIPISSEEMALAVTLKKKAQDHPIAGPLLAALDAVELSFTATSMDFGLDLKCKVDGLICPEDPASLKAMFGDIIPDVGDFGAIIVDIKTTQQYDRWRSVCRKNSYYRADAFYSHVVNNILDRPVLMLFMVLEMAPLARVKVTRSSDDDIQRGWDEASEALTTINHCLRTNQWHNPADMELQTLHLYQGTAGRETGGNRYA